MATNHKRMTWIPENAPDDIEPTAVMPIATRRAMADIEMDLEFILRYEGGMINSARLKCFAIWIVQN